jgi:hypothetical protein
LIFLPAGSPFRLSLFPRDRLLAVAGRRQQLRGAAMSNAHFMSLALRLARPICQPGYAQPLLSQNRTTTR